MSRKSRIEPAGLNGKTIEQISREEGARLVDRQARKFLNMSGKEFVRRYRDGSLENPHSLAVARVAILLPLVEQ
jgi:hypothetical protein